MDDEPVSTEVEDYDAAHEALDGSPLMRSLWAEAMGEEYPAEVEPFSSCSWWLLGHIVAALRLPPDGRLVDLGCGGGGPGLWIARACSARLIGIDFSPVAVRIAARRATRFVVAGRAEFRCATVDRTGLPDSSVDAVMSVDALPFATDRPAALREVKRILVPGGRLAATVRTRDGDGPRDWPAMATGAGFAVEASLPIPGRDEFWQRLYRLWFAHEPELRVQLGDRVADNLLREARPAVARTDEPPRAVLLVLRR